VPVPTGAGKGKGIGKIVLGVALIAASVFMAGTTTAAAAAAAGSTTAAEAAIAGGTAAGGSLLGLSFGQMASFGLTMVLGGVSQLLTVAPKVNDYSSRNAPDQRPSFLFNGPVNVSEQGGPVPLVYGRVRVGSIVVSSGLKAEQIAA
jgi:predicted phage tail protein